MKEYLVIEYDGMSEYYFYNALVHDSSTHVDETIDLFYSEIDRTISEEFKGKLAASLKTKGEGVTLFFPGVDGSSKYIDLDYSQIEYVAMLYNLYNSTMKRDKSASYKYFEKIENEEIN